MKRKAIVPNIFTAFSLSCGLFVIFKMNMLQPGTASYHTIVASVCILMLAAVLDFMDGAIARAMKVESEFGGVFDSMADGISFGVAPSALVLKTLSLEQGTMLSFVLTTGAMIYAICGVLRLVRFRVASHENQGNKEKIALSMANFTGLPIPAAGAIVTSTTLLFMSEEFQNFYPMTDMQRAIFATVVFFVMGFFMISRWKFPSLKALHIRVGSFQVIALTVIIAAVILIGALQHFALVFAGLSWAYFLLAVVLSLVRIISGKKLRVLEDFEPDSEDEI